MLNFIFESLLALRTNRPTVEKIQVYCTIVQITLFEKVQE